MYANDARALGRHYHLFMRWLRLRRLSIPPLLFDVALAALLGVVGAAQLWTKHSPFSGDEDRFRPTGGTTPDTGGGGPEPFSPDFVSYSLLALTAGSLVFRSRYPLLTLAGVTTFGAAYLTTGAPVFTVQIIVLVAVYSAVADAHISRGPAILVSLLCGAVLGAAIWVSGEPRSDAQWAMDAAWLLAAMFLGDSQRSRREAALESSRTQEEEARRRVSEERLKIARDLHDVVGHNISLINVQASAGSHVLYQDAGQSKETFDNIREASHETLQELRSLVGVLRDPATGESRAPTDGLDQLDRLIRGFVEAGQHVDLRITGNRRHISGVVDLSAYRIVQEALTNAVQHAPGANVIVTVDYGEDAVSVSVTNEASQTPSSSNGSGGHGLVGMRERVLAIGGRLDAGPEANGGFRVRATLPLAGGAS